MSQNIPRTAREEAASRIFVLERETERALEDAEQHEESARRARARAAECVSLCEQWQELLTPSA